MDPTSASATGGHAATNAAYIAMVAARTTLHTPDLPPADEANHSPQKQQQQQRRQQDGRRDDGRRCRSRRWPSSLLVAALGLVAAADEKARGPHSAPWAERVSSPAANCAAGGTSVVGWVVVGTYVAAASIASSLVLVPPPPRSRWRRPRRLLPPPPVGRAPVQTQPFSSPFVATVISRSDEVGRNIPGRQGQVSLDTISSANTRT